MSVISIFNGIFCNEAEVTQEIVANTGHRFISDEFILEKASKLSGIQTNQIMRAFSSKSSVFNQFTYEKECSIAYLRLALSMELEEDNLIISGYSGLLIPKTIHHVLRVCLIANRDFRLETAKKKQKLTEEEARHFISDEDMNRSAWTNTLFSKKDPWNPELYDIVLSMEKTAPAIASALIEENLPKDAVKQTNASRSAVNDFILATKVEVALVNAGHNIGVHATNGNIILTINKKVLMLSRLEDELKSISEKIPGVLSVETCIENGKHPSQNYRKLNNDSPSKVLLVDDEKEFVQTLSERLQMRDMGSVVAYDGDSALNLVRNDDPEVMIIDLKMPGLDGMEILEEVKHTKPEIEVIVLTGHGSEKDKIRCMDLGAFAYMQKPVDINILSQTLKKAHKKFKTSI